MTLSEALQRQERVRNQWVYRWENEITDIPPSIKDDYLVVWSGMITKQQMKHHIPAEDAEDLNRPKKWRFVQVPLAERDTDTRVIAFLVVNTGRKSDYGQTLYLLEMLADKSDFT